MASSENDGSETDADWEHFAKENPFFAVLTDEKYKSVLESEDIKTDFFLTGKQHIARTISVLKEHFDFDPLAINTSVDFGSGVGRLLFPMAQNSKLAIGVDISPTMRAVAKQISIDMGISNIILSPDIDVVFKSSNEINWVNSDIVFQHIPPHRGYHIFAEIIKGLSCGGYLSIHFTLFKDIRAIQYFSNRVKYYINTPNECRSILLYSDKTRHREMKMYDYDLNTLFSILIDNNISKMFFEHVDQDGFHGVRIYAKK